MYEFYMVTDYASGGDLFNVLRKVVRDSHDLAPSVVDAVRALPLNRWMLNIATAVVSERARRGASERGGGERAND